MRQKQLLALLLFAFCSLTVPAAWTDQGSAINPARLCEDTGCSAPMIRISKDYSEGFADFANQDLSGYSGKCFHLNSIYDPSFAHFGAFIFTRSQNTLSINGIFGFFYESDPYAGMTAAEMKTALESNGSKASPGILRPDHVELAYTYSTSMVRYWFRSNKSKTALFVIGQQVDNSSAPSMVFCKLLRH